MGDYKILSMRGHFEVFNANNDFVLSADTHKEAVEEIAILLSEQ